MAIGSDDTKVEMASIVGKMTLTSNGKEQLARRSAKVLVEMLSKPAGQASSLQALQNLSSLDDNATILVDSNVLPALTDILFRYKDVSTESKELAALIVANIVSNPGHWELASADKEGHSMQSESIVFSLLALLEEASSRCQVSILHILCGIAFSPQASGNSLLFSSLAIYLQVLLIQLLCHPSFCCNAKLCLFIRLICISYWLIVYMCKVEDLN